ncbi:MAG: hypothetical protein RR840_04965 [Clostridium sp.]
MIYFILIVGLLLIYLSIRRGQKTKITEIKQENFDSLLESGVDEFYEREILKSYIDLERRVEILEEKLLKHETSQKSYDKETIKNDEEYIESILEVVNETEDIYVKEVETKVNKGDIGLDKNGSILNSKVITLYNEGKSVEDIASMLRIGKGEVLLRIGLQKRQK